MNYYGLFDGCGCHKFIPLIIVRIFCQSFGMVRTINSVLHLFESLEELFHLKWHLLFDHFQTLLQISPSLISSD